MSYDASVPPPHPMDFTLCPATPGPPKWKQYQHQKWQKQKNKKLTNNKKTSPWRMRSRYGQVLAISRTGSLDLPLSLCSFNRAKLSLQEDHCLIYTERLFGCIKIKITYPDTGLFSGSSMRGGGMRNQRGIFFFRHCKAFYSSSPFGKEIFKLHAFLERIFKKHSTHKNSVHPTKFALVLRAFANTVLHFEPISICCLRL